MDQDERIDQLRRRFIRETEDGLEALANSPDLKEEWRRLSDQLDSSVNAPARTHPYPAQMNPPRPAA